MKIFIYISSCFEPENWDAGHPKNIAEKIPIKPMSSTIVINEVKSLGAGLNCRMNRPPRNIPKAEGTTPIIP
jgi:hypothetical protein